MDNTLMCNGNGFKCDSGRNQCNQRMGYRTDRCEKQNSCGVGGCGQQHCGFNVEGLIDRINKAILLDRGHMK